MRGTSASRSDAGAFPAGRRGHGRVAARQGFEPRRTDPESVVLPLHHRAERNADKYSISMRPRQHWPLRRTPADSSRSVQGTLARTRDALAALPSCRHRPLPRECRRNLDNCRPRNEIWLWDRRGPGLHVRPGQVTFPLLALTLPHSRSLTSLTSRSLTPRKRRDKVRNSAYGPDPQCHPRGELHE